MVVKSHSKAFYTDAFKRSTKASYTDAFKRSSKAFYTDAFKRSSKAFYTDAFKRSSKDLYTDAFKRSSKAAQHFKKEISKNLLKGLKSIFKRYPKLATRDESTLIWKYNDTESFQGTLEITPTTMNRSCSKSAIIIPY